MTREFHKMRSKCHRPRAEAGSVHVVEQIPGAEFLRPSFNLEKAVTLMGFLNPKRQ